MLGAEQKDTCTVHWQHVFGTRWPSALNMSVTQAVTIASSQYLIVISSKGPGLGSFGVGVAVEVLKGVG